MRNATKATVSTFGAIMGLAGIEHGIGEILQGNVAPDGIVILSWPDSAFFRIQAGEPAMTIIPNLLVTGILASLFSLIFIVWATMLVQRKNGGLILILISIAMLLVGAGFGPPLMGIIVGVAATRINAPGLARYSVSLRSFLGKLWPWSFAAGLIAWLLLMPGSNLLDYFWGINELILIPVLLFFALGFLLLTMFTGFAYDSIGGG